ncbi:mucin-4 [Hippopotamus amphibius kiboko]|uniref:mucin-4 n=1 Tax=Hippopotamus amphibius kiboko TaxID=575201 RepID=UPI0025948729|nr:mucin-4 [Hippopotamus amphibius kiboko]
MGRLTPRSKNNANRAGTENKPLPTAHTALPHLSPRHPHPLLAPVEAPAGRTGEAAPALLRALGPPWPPPTAPSARGEQPCRDLPAVAAEKPAGAPGVRGSRAPLTASSGVLTVPRRRLLLRKNLFKTACPCLSHTPGTTSETLTATTSADKTSPPPSTGNTSPMIAPPTSTDPTAENTKDTSLPVTSITRVASTVSMTPGLDKQSTLSSSTTSTEQTSASSQDHQTQSMETTRETQTSIITQMIVPPTSTDPTTENTKDTSLPVTSITPVAATVSMTTGLDKQSTLSSSTTSTEQTSASSQDHQTQSMETTRETQTSIITQIIASPTSTDPTTENRKDTSLPVTSITPLASTVSMTTGLDKQSTLSSSTTSAEQTSASSQDHQTQSMETTRETQTSIITQMIAPPTSTDPTTENRKDTSLPVTSITPVAATVSMTTGLDKQSTLSSSTTSTEQTSASSQDHQTQSMETTRETQTSIITQVTTSTPSSPPSAHKSTEGVSQETSPSSETTSSSPSSLSHTPGTTTGNTSPVTSKMIVPPTSTDPTTENTKDTSLPVTSITPVAATVSMTTGLDKQSTLSSSTTSTEQTSASSQDHQTQSMETTRETQTSIITEFQHYTSQDNRIIHSTNFNGHHWVIHPVGSGNNSLTNTARVPTSSSGESGAPTPEHPVTRPTYVAPASGGNSAAGSTRASPSPPTSRLSIRTSPDTPLAGRATALCVPSSSPPSAAPSSPAGKTETPGRWGFGVSVSGSGPAGSAPCPCLGRDGARALPGWRAGARGGTTAASQTENAGRTAAPLPAAASQALTAPAARTSTGARGSAAPAPTEPERGASLFSYGPRAGDQEFVKRTVDFTSPLFKPRIGFPLGSSLRDSLYFTDNGQIIFPESEYQIFSYPNPPLGGFTAWDPVALVAPFWDDADFSSSRGTIFYQEYETLSDEYSLLVREVEASIKTFTDTWNYKARWTLKVTWVRAPSYPAWGTVGANTYQAILSTDGSRSYALFLYQSGGMQWDVTRRPGNPVLMGFSSGDGYFQNSPLTFQPVWEKYRPDQFLDSKSGLRGLQIYKLHREEKPNYRLQCLQWLKRQSQQPSWGWSHTPCPCSWNQGQWDLRFQATNIGWGGPGSRQLCSFSSWRGGVCCRYGPWGELLQGWRVQSPWQFDQELEPQNWCCRFNDNPSLCALYQMRRPRVSCAGYQPPRPAWMFGDPHIVTLDGANYTFNGLGDFLLVRTQDRNSSFLLQGRTAQTGVARATSFIAFAAEYRSSSLDPITVQWLLQPNDTVHVRLGQRSVTFASNREGADGQETVNASGVVLTRAGSEVSAAFDGAVTVSVVALSGVLHASCSLPQAYRGRTEGLLGFWNGRPDDDFRMPDGSTLDPASSEETLFRFGMAWEINGTRLFGKRDDHLPSNFTPVFRSQLSRNTSSDANLTSECHGDERCVFDALATGSKRLGLHTGMLFRRYQRRNTTLNEYPPSVEGPDVVKAYMGQARRVRYTSSAKDVTFTLRNSCADFTLFENGTLLWTPKLLEPCTLEILARSAKDNLSSVLQPRTVVCACRAESQCLYNQTRRVGSSSLEVADCTCDGDTYGRYCNRSKDPCDEPCFPHVTCVPGKGCEACPPSLTGDGRHCAPLGSPSLCGSRACPAGYCYNSGRCHVAGPPACRPRCTCPPAFTDGRCFLAGNDFPPSVRPELPLRIIQLSLSEDENASQAEVNASVAHRLRNLDVQAFLWNRRVDRAEPPAALASGGSLHRWNVISEFQYRAGGPAVDFLNNRLLDAVVEAFLPRAPWRGRKSSAGPRNDVTFHPVSRRDVYSVKALNLSMLETYLQCSGYEGYHLVFSPQSGFTCVSPCSQGYCEHGGQCQHLPDGPRCSCEPFSIYAPWGPRCERLSLRLGAFFGILFGALGALLLLGVVGCVVLRFWGSPRTRFSYPLASDR